MSSITLALGWSSEVDILGMPRQRLTVRGRVQGMTLRAQTQSQAQKFGLGGWIRNEPDGTVTMEAEGEASSLAALKTWLKSGTRWAKVEVVEVIEVPPNGEKDFVVRA